MKKILMLFVAAMFISAASAQEKGQMAAGVNLNFGFGYAGSYSNIGIGAKYQYSFTDHLRIEPAFTYFFKKDFLSTWDFMANVHYVFPIAQKKMTVYPLLGVGVFGAKVKVLGVSASDTNFGLNIGGGYEYCLKENIALGAELKYQVVSGYGHLGIQIGAKYVF